MLCELPSVPGKTMASLKITEGEVLARNVGLIAAVASSDMITLNLTWALPTKGLVSAELKAPVPL
jgi:hypothetical protein